MTERILRLKAVLDRTGLSRSALYRKIAEGSFPRQLKLSALQFRLARIRRRPVGCRSCGLLGGAARLADSELRVRALRIATAAKPGRGLTIMSRTNVVEVFSPLAPTGRAPSPGLFRSLLRPFVADYAPSLSVRTSRRNATKACNAGGGRPASVIDPQSAQRRGPVRQDPMESPRGEVACHIVLDKARDASFESGAARANLASSTSRSGVRPAR